MSQAFQALRGLILIPAELEGAYGTIPLRLALDTGATRTSIRTGSLLQAGYDPSQAQTHVRATTASGVVWLPQLPVIRVKALGQDRRNFYVLAHTPPPTATFDGLLGLDFLRGQMLTIDFRQGQILLS
jgi:predicted aspartyl protease